jgi:hypothetical protein
MLRAPQSKFEKMFLGIVPPNISPKEMYDLLGTQKVDDNQYSMYIVANFPEIAEKAFIRLDHVKYFIDEKTTQAELKHLIDTVFETKSSKSIRDLTYYFLDVNMENWSTVKEEFNKIAWGIPSDESIKFIKTATLKHFRKHPNARLVDIGTGSGAFPLMLVDAGIPKERIIAIDFDQTMCDIELFPITRIQKSDDPELDAIEVIRHIQKDDIVLIVWGYCIWRTWEACKNFGIETFIIQGELEDGCTFPVDYVSNSPEWDMVQLKLPTPCALNENVAIWKKKILNNPDMS